MHGRQLGNRHVFAFLVNTIYLDVRFPVCSQFTRHFHTANALKPRANFHAGSSRIRIRYFGQESRVRIEGPIGVALRTRKAPATPREKMPWWGVFAIPFGRHNPDWEVSPWIHIPLRIFLVVAFLWVVLIVIMASLNSK